ncbi:hypothetical protein BGZ99_005139 [Dissophora globulifera]|uniref:PWWP domain-containing protein n=1 Tax=Dissophora globulifera TaxID=979702 RepID=A0A9P6UU66_9FUNG|nr:hypothetical protein BGZ99_005139 [Dissophora globulifera]
MTSNPHPVGTVVFAKLKGYPWWPARIENEDGLPDNVNNKKPKQRPIWPVFFFGSYDYGWFGTSELKEFDPASAEKARSSLRKGNALRTALSEALDPSLIPNRITAAKSDEDDEQDEEEEIDEALARKKAAAKPKKTTKSEPAEKKRRSSTTEDQAAKRKPSKRAVPADEEEDEEEAPKAKKRVTITARSRVESDKRSLDEDISSTEVSNGRTRKSEDDAGDSGDHGRAKKKIRSGQPNERLLKLRHKLQKLLLVEGLSDEVLVQNLERADPILTEVEAFEIDLQMLKDTKIGRLMKKISILQFSQDPHQIVDRSVKLIKQYKIMMEKAQENGGAGGPVSPSEQSADASIKAIEDKASVVGKKPVGIVEGVISEGVVLEGVKPQTPIASSHILDVPPAPEAVVAAVAAIVETSALLPTEISHSVISDTTATTSTTTTATETSTSTSTTTTTSVAEVATSASSNLESTA